MRIVVTGSSGNVGQSVVSCAIGRGHEVWAVDRRTSTVDEDPDAVHRHVLDLQDGPAVVGFMETVRPDAVIHLAAIPSPETDPAWVVFGTNTRSTFDVMEAAGVAAVARVAIASSIALLGMAFATTPLSPLFAPVDESHPNIGGDAYALSKEVDEATARMMQRRHGYQVLALRIMNSAPMAQQTRRASAALGDPCRIAGELWSYLDIRDAARAFVLAVERDVPGFHVLNIAAPDTYSAAPTAELMDRCHPTTPLRRPLVGRETPMDLTAAQTLLGFQAQHLIAWPLDDGSEAE